MNASAGQIGVDVFIHPRLRGRVIRSRNSGLLRP